MTTAPASARGACTLHLHICTRSRPGYFFYYLFELAATRHGCGERSSSKSTQAAASSKPHRFLCGFQIAGYLLQDIGLPGFGCVHSSSSRRWGFCHYRLLEIALLERDADSRAVAIDSSAPSSGHARALAFGVRAHNWPTQRRRRHHGFRARVPISSLEVSQLTHAHPDRDRMDDFPRCQFGSCEKVEGEGFEWEWNVDMEERER